MPTLIVFGCGLLFAIFALLAPDIAWPLFKVVVYVTEIVVLVIAAIWGLMCWPQGVT